MIYVSVQFFLVGNFSVVEHRLFWSSLTR